MTKKVYILIDGETEIECFLRVIPDRNSTMRLTDEFNAKQYNVRVTDVKHIINFSKVEHGLHITAEEDIVIHCESNNT